VSEIELLTESANETRSVAAALAERARPGDLVLLNGPLGAGKTEFAKGFAAGLGVSADEPVVSPTFVLMRQYAGRLRLDHADLYRVGGASEVFELGLLEDADARDGVRLVEWAERFPALWPPEAVVVTLEYSEDAPSRRRVRVALPSETDAAALRGRLAAAGLKARACR